MDQDKRPKGYKWWLFKRVAKRKTILSSVIIMTVAVALITMLIPVFFGFIIDDVLIEFSKSRSEKKNILLDLVIVLLILVVLKSIFGYITVVTNDYLAWATEKDIREEFFEEIQSKPLEYHDRVATGEIMALATNDLRMVNGMISPGTRMVAEVFLGLFFAALLAFSVLDIRFLLITLPFVPLYIWTASNYNKKLAPIASTFMRKWSNIAAQMQDSVYGAEVVRAFTGEDFERVKFEGAVVDFRNTWIKQQKIQALYYPLLILYLAIGTSFVFGVTWVHNGDVSLGQLVAFIGLLVTLIGPTERLYFSTNMFQGGLAGSARICGAICEGEKEESQALWHWPSELKGKIVFDNVSFSYNQGLKPVLKGINLTIEPGTSVALVGPTGCGKSTLTKLLLRLYKPSDGQITIDDVPLKEFELEELRQNIGRIEQDIYLFPRSIKENIAFGKPDATDHEIQEVARLAQADEFINNQPDGFDTNVGERGVRLSGGQRQRIAIARAFLTDPKLLILDDSTSAIDSETEARIVNAIETLLKGRTTLVITHRLHTIRQCDKVVVLKEGEIIAEGSHDDLLQTSEAYRRVFGKHIDLPPLVISKDLVSTKGEV